ncbi:hypothetical protein ACVIJ6_002414 [Bradyrhizobium sp. USDA 4369]
MRRVLVCVAAVVSLSVGSVGASAQGCNLGDFGKGGLPPPVRDVTPQTKDSRFEWGSDVDPWNGQARAWHYIKNLHDKKLSLDWKKPALIIPFDKPLEPGGVFCKNDYGSLESYQLDHDAPISVSNDGMKSAEAYVQVPGKRDTAGGPKTTGAELRRTYQTGAGEIAEAFARIVLRYYPEKKSLQVDLATGPGDIRVGFGAEMLGATSESFVQSLKTRDLDFRGPMPLGELLKQEDFRAIGFDPRYLVALVRINGGRSLMIENALAPSGVTPMLLLAPDGAALGLTTVKLDLLGSTR